MEDIKNRLLEQIALQERIRAKAGVNLVTCGNCGSVMLHEVILLESERCDDITCPFCNTTSDPCDFPDLFYTGMELWRI